MNRPLWQAIQADQIIMGVNIDISGQRVNLGSLVDNPRAVSTYAPCIKCKLCYRSTHTQVWAVLASSSASSFPSPPSCLFPPSPSSPLLLPPPPLLYYSQLLDIFNVTNIISSATGAVGNLNIDESALIPTDLVDSLSSSLPDIADLDFGTSFATVNTTLMNATVDLDNAAAQLAVFINNTRGAVSVLMSLMYLVIQWNLSIMITV